AGLSDSGQLAVVSHFAESNSREPELPEVTTRATIDLVPIAKANGRGIARQPLQCQACRLALPLGGIGGGQLPLASCAALCIAFNDDATLLVACDLGLLSHVRSALLSEIDVLADDGIVLLEHDAVRAVAAVLAGHVGVPGAGGRLELDDGTNILGLGH